jgi:hypothetical protein
MDPGVFDLSSCNCGGTGDCLVLAAAALAIQVARGHTVEDIELLSALFTAIGANLTLIALKVPQDVESNPAI